MSRILNPNALGKLLEDAGLRSESQIDDLDLGELLARHDFQTSDIISELSDLMRNGATEAIRLRAAEVGARLNGLLRKDDELKEPISVNINIVDSDGSKINAFLLPRGLTPPVVGETNA